MNEAALRRLFSRLTRPTRAHAPYDFLYQMPTGPVYVKSKRPIGTSVTMSDQQIARLTALGDAVLWIGGSVIPVRALRGVAHRHVHALDASVKTVVFRIVAGRARPPRYCFGKCEGSLP